MHGKTNFKKKIQKDLEHSNGNSDINIVTELDNAK